MAQLPLYTLWRTGTASVIAQAVIHCTFGDVLIGTVTLIPALAAVGSPAWPNETIVSVAVAVVIMATGYTVYSEYMNTAVRGSWTPHLSVVRPYSVWTAQMNSRDRLRLPNSRLIARSPTLM